MKIVFYSNQLSERGTETALIDYAFANKEILKNESLLAFPKKAILSQSRFDYLKKFFDIYLIEDVKEFNDFLLAQNVDLLYLIVDGISPDIADEITGIKTFVHAVFSTRRRHGTYYCPIHEYLNRYYGTCYPVLPHIVKKLPLINENYREMLKIPKDSKVFGCYAGKNQFDMPFVKKAVYNIAKQSIETYFIFMNIENFIKQDFHDTLTNVIFLPGSTDGILKSKFIQTCDAMIHGRSDGETFGLSVAEFSSFNKPIITYKPSLLKKIIYFLKSYGHRRLTYSEAHIINLGEKGFYYRNKKELIKIINNFNKSISNYDCYTKTFSEENVIYKFLNILNGINK